jgi:hypothetical protein
MALPGQYDVLTMQVNVTLHPRSTLVKAVLIIRDPSDQIELYRTHMDPTPASIGLGATEGAFRASLAYMRYLAGWIAADVLPEAPIA